MNMQWNCVGCDACGEVSCEPSTTIETLLSDILMQHEVLRPECHIIRTGDPQISIWEPQGSSE
jgi:hypothetical protein